MTTPTLAPLDGALQPADRRRAVATVLPAPSRAAPAKPVISPTNPPSPGAEPALEATGSAIMPRVPALPRRAALAATLVGALGLAACSGTADGSQPAPVTEARRALVVSSDTTVRAAQAALAEARPFRATQLLAPVLRDPARRTPEAVLLAATAAARWEGWATVQTLLAGEPWLDARFDGEGHELLARAALARGQDSVAATHAERALARAGGDEARGVRSVLLARALEGVKQDSAAAAAYARAAELLPPSADWLRLRAAALTADGARRAAHLARVEAPLVARRAPLVEARARERQGDLRGAARAFADAGEPAESLRLLLQADSADPAALATHRTSLLRLIADRRGSADARAAAAMLQERFAPLAPGEALAVARSLAVSGPGADAARLFAAADGQVELEVPERIAYARVLFALGRYPQAAAQWARVPDAHPEAASAAYERARALLRAGRMADTRAALRAIPARFPSDVAANARALFLLADLATDENRDAAARAAFRDLARRYPTSALAPRARVQAALIAYVDGEHRAAGAELDTVAMRYPTSGETPRALYWAGRAWRAAGDARGAADRWRQAIAREPLSYYAVLAARRLDTAGWSPEGADARPPSPPAPLRGALARIDQLERVGLAAEARAEYDRLAVDADSSAALLLATAEAFQERGLSSRGIALGTRALQRGAPRDVRTYRVLYPVVHRDVLAAEARERRLDPALVAALIRQESQFLATARSPADARGLMQLMPTVGRAIARGMDFPVWEEALLYQPDVNIRLGTAHLSSLVRQYDALPHVLAAYNAGGSRVTRWLKKRGTARDPEIFAERIPYEETRDYVRIVERNRALYEALYEW